MKEKESPPKHENWEDESRKQLAKFDTVPTTKESIYDKDPEEHNYGCICMDCQIKR